MTNRIDNLVDRYLREQTTLELNDAAFALLNELLDFHHSASLLITRASVGEKIVAVIKDESEEAP